MVLVLTGNQQLAAGRAPGMNLGEGMTSEQRRRRG
jgi:hypothetical protein